MADVTSALGLATVARTIYILRAPEPVDPQLTKAIGHHLGKLANEVLSPRPSTRINKDSHQPEQPAASSLADESQLPEDQVLSPET